jgi:hypothetical protein
LNELGELVLVNASWLKHRTFAGRAFVVRGGRNEPATFRIAAFLDYDVNDHVLTAVGPSGPGVTFEKTPTPPVAAEGGVAVVA